MRTRIGSVKSTQKITKALQMVAAAKLRRAQDAAAERAPLRHAHGRGDRQPGRRASPARARRCCWSGTGSRPARAGRGRDRRPRPRRRLQLRHRPRRARADRPPPSHEGREVKLLTIGRKARDQLRRLYGDRSVGALRSRRQSRPWPALRRPPTAILERFEAGEADVVTLFYSRFRSVVSQVPTRQQLIPAQIEGAAPIDLKGAVYEYEPDEETILEDPAAAQHLACSCSPPCSRTRPASSPPRWRRWTTPPATPAT